MRTHDHESVTMPIFGARMVCDSGNYRHIQEVTRLERERETNLGK